MKVLIVQEELKHYRYPLYQEMFIRSQDYGVEFKLVYSAPSEVEAKKNDNVEGELAWSNKVKIFRIGKIVIQFPIKEILWADRVVVGQANGYLLNYLLIIFCAMSAKKLIFWGHGYNHQSSGTILERFKKQFLHIPWRWLAYTESVKKYLVGNGVKGSSVYVLNNSVDVDDFRNSVRCLKKINEKIDDQVIDFVFCGSIYKNKMIDFIFDSVALAQKKLSSTVKLNIHIVGDGPDRLQAERSAQNIGSLNVVFHGALRANDKALIFSNAYAVLNPGLVGLGVLDAFACGIPILTTNVKIHSPEFSYIENLSNGLITESCIHQYSDAICRIVEDKVLYQTLCKGSIESSYLYDIKSMAARYLQGIS